MHSLREVLRAAQEKRVAAGHFNIADLVLLKAVFESARELQAPVLVGASEGERAFVGTSTFMRASPGRASRRLSSTTSRTSGPPKRETTILR